MSFPQLRSRPIYQPRQSPTPPPAGGQYVVLTAVRRLFSLIGQGLAR